MKTLDQIGKKYSTDKSSICYNFCNFYDLHLNHLRNSELKILEIGIA